MMPLTWDPDVLVAHASHPGCVRRRNEDCIAVLEEQGIFVLADGIGGHRGGAAASRIAVNRIARCVSNGKTPMDGLLEANRTIVSRGRQLGARNMGTTVVVVVVDAQNFRVAWVGDSRAYRINRGIERLTSDHSLVARMVSSGRICESEARAHPMRNLLTRALGDAGLSPSRVGTMSGRLRPGDRLLLCSDGLHGLLDDEELQSIIRAATSTQAAVRKLLQTALDRGGPDNISLILISQVKAAI